MRYTLGWSFYFLIAASAYFGLSAWGAFAKPIDWSKPQNIDPLDKHVVDFLDTDLASVERDALRAFAKGDYLEAARQFLFLLRHRSDDMTATYNLACCYAHLGKPKMAAACLDKAAAAGFVDVDYVLMDPDFEAIREHRAFEKTIKSIRRQREAQGRVLYVSACKLVKCHLQLPKGFDPEKAVPLIIGLHGNGGKAENFIRVWEKMQHRDFVFAVPEGPYPKPSTAGGIGGGFSWGILAQDHETWRRGDPLTISYISELVQQFSSFMNIESVYLLGFSQGAAYAYLTAISKPDVFDGVIGFGGRLPDLDAPYSVCTPEDFAKARNLGVFIGHGTKDRAIGIKAGLNAKDRFEAAGYDVVFRRFEGGHEIPPDVLNAALSWMKRRIRQEQ